MVRGVRRPVQLEGSEQSLGCTGWCGPRGEGFSDSRAKGPCEKLVVAFKLLCNVQTGADGLVHTIFDFAGAKQVEHRGGQPRGSEDRRRGGELGGDQGGQAPVQQGDLLKTGRPERRWTSWLLMRYWTHRLLQSHHRHQSTPQEAGLVCFEFQGTHCGFARFARQGTVTIVPQAGNFDWRLDIGWTRRTRVSNNSRKTQDFHDSLIKAKLDKHRTHDHFWFDL